LDVKVFDMIVVFSFLGRKPAARVSCGFLTYV